jgi:hypothetical protein
VLRLKASPLAFRKSALEPIRAELIGSEYCSALGLAIESATPVLALCQQLIEAGHDPATPLNAYRGETLCLRVRSIGEAAQLEVDGHGCGFRPACGGGIAPLVSSGRRAS